MTAADWPVKDGSECPICGKRAIVICRDPLDEEVGGRTYSVDGFEYNLCTACGESFFSGFQCDEISKRANELARADLGRLSPDEIRQLRLDLGLTQTGLEAQLGASVGMVGRWERGTVLQGSIADRFMRLLRSHPGLLAESPAPVARESRGPYRKKRLPTGEVD